MRSDKSSLSVVQDALGLGAGKVDTAYSIMEKTIARVNEIKDKLVAATGASDADKAKIQTEITALQAQLKMGADGATYSGSNLLSQNTTTGTAVAGVSDVAKIVSAFTRSSAGAIIPADDRHHGPEHQAVRGLRNAPRKSQKGIIDGLRLATTGARSNHGDRDGRQAPPRRLPTAIASRR